VNARQADPVAAPPKAGEQLKAGEQPRYPQKRAAIARAALDLFMREGFEQTSMDAIAAEAGVSKRTVYSHYANKHQLFLAVFEETLAAVMNYINDMAERELYPPGDITARLTGFIRPVAHTIIRLPERAALLRVIITEGPRFPELVEQWQGRRALTPLLERALARLGPDSELDIPDPWQAAGHLAALTFGQINSRMLFGLLRLADEELDEIVTSGVDVFVRAYRRTAPRA